MPETRDKYPTSFGETWEESLYFFRTISFAFCVPAQPESTQFAHSVYCTHSLSEENSSEHASRNLSPSSWDEKSRNLKILGKFQLSFSFPLPSVLYTVPCFIICFVLPFSVWHLFSSLSRPQCFYSSSRVSIKTAHFLSFLLFSFIRGGACANGTKAAIFNLLLASPTYSCELKRASPYYCRCCRGRQVKTDAINSKSVLLGLCLDLVCPWGALQQTRRLWICVDWLLLVHKWQLIVSLT